MADALGDLARSGPAALRGVFACADAELRATGDFSRALLVLRDEAEDPVADRVASALLLARDIGGRDLGVLLRSVSSFLRQDARLRAELRGRQSWTIAAARMALAAPWLTLVLLCTRPDAARAYASVPGAIVLAIAAAVSVGAYGVMRRIGRLPEGSA
jgi:tight adherence protein B